MEGGHYLVIAAAVLAGVFLLGCDFGPEIQFLESAEGGKLVKNFRWDFNGQSYAWNVSIPLELYQEYRSRPRDCGYHVYATDDGDDEYIRELSSKLSGAEAECDWSGKIDFVLSLVQSLEYAEDEDGGYDEYPRYPIETMFDGKGDCEDTAILFVSIISEMGYGVVLLKFDESQHMAAGVRIDESVISDWPKDYPLTYYTKNGVHYAYCETTGSGWRIGEKPEWMTDDSALLIQV